MSIECKTKLTSVKIIENLYNEFRHISLDDDINLQKLVNRSILLYISDDDNFRDKIKITDELLMSGSSF
tara:strand:- start:47281 stop:47487 length:207 start_codon:yes stop_codon:yes gene_type:complete